jgi:hypothetical protein
MSKNTLWDNAMVRDAKARMSKEEIEQYKKIGEQFYKDMDFQQGNSIENIIKESASYLSTLLNSGLLPHNLNKDEKRVLKEVYGDKWYEKWGYTEKDLSKSE